MVHYIVTYEIINKKDDRQYEQLDDKKEVVEAVSKVDAWHKIKRKYVSENTGVFIKRIDLTLISPDISAGEIH